MPSPDFSTLIAAARQARQYARADHSRYAVGAALETADGRLFTGANVECSSYGLSLCAERVALVKALSEGADRFTRLAVVTASEPPASPCGACRQMLWDYARDLEIVLAGSDGEGDPVVTSLRELFPRGFGCEDL
ncbi:MAG: cytidine deaminase [Candidatus Zixiibacteriota bacterium]|nr:MAG: cytidine deaminase [candidate division Zixibacteria bacterium]